MADGKTPTFIGDTEHGVECEWREQVEAQMDASLQPTLNFTTYNSST